MKLKKIVSKFSTNGLVNKSQLAKDFQLLDEYLDDIFPNQETTKKIVKNLTKDDGESNFIFHFKTLPFRTRDDIWLSMFIERVLCQIISLKKDQAVFGEEKSQELLPYRNVKRDTFYFSPVYELAPVSTKTILKYVKTSPKFEARRSQFEQDFVKAYIAKWIVTNQPDAFFNEAKRKSIETDVNFAKNFPIEIMQMMTNIGIAKKNIEIALTATTGIWLRSTLRKTFINRNNLYSVPNLTMLKKYDVQAWRVLSEMKTDSMENWVNIKEKEYFDKNKRMMNKYGVMSKAMKMDTDKLEELRLKNRKYDLAYQTVIFNNLVNLDYDNLNK